MAQATLEINAAISQILPSLPAGTQLTVRRMDPTVFPIIAYSLTSKTLSPVALRALARYQLRPLLSSVTGVARVGVLGGEKPEFRVTVDPARLAADGLAFSDVARALGDSNVIKAVGRLEEQDKLYLVIGNSRLTDIATIGRTVLRSGKDGLVRLDDVAKVTSSTVPQWVRVTADGRPAVIFQVFQQPGGNSVRIARDVRTRIAAFRPQLPKGVTISNWYDQSRLVVASATSVRDAILIGIVLAAIVLLLFLRNLKITFIAILVVPTVLSTTVVLLDVLGMSFNIMTLGGMAAAVGLIIDDAIVMIEHIVRRLRSAGTGHHGRVMAAAREFLHPLAGSSAATVIIFAPLAFLSGVTGAFFKALSLTMASALIISFLITWLAVPLLADHLLGARDANQKEGGALTDWFHVRYERLLKRLLARPLLLLLIVVPLLGAGWLAFAHVGSGFMPAMDEGGFIIDYHTPPGTSLSETDRLLRQVETIISATPEVAAYTRRTGTGLGGDLNEANQGDFFVRLKPLPRRPIEEVMDDIRGRIETQVPGVHVEMAQLMEDLIGDLTAVPQPIEVKIYSDQQQVLDRLAHKVAGQLGHVPGVVDIDNGINPAGDALEVQVDPVKAAIEGVDAKAVTTQVEQALSGEVATELAAGERTVGVRVWIPAARRRTRGDLESLLLRAPDGHLFPLRRVARVVTVTGQPQITRENLKRMVAVTARISGRDLGSTIRDVRRLLDRPGEMPPEVYYELGGLYHQQQIAFAGLRTVFIAAVVLVFVLLLFLYERFRVAISILVTPLLATAAVFIGLWATGIELNISALMGMTMIIGIVTEVAIVYFSEYQELSRTLERRAALVAAGRNRMRPIAMTTFAAILTLLPLAFAIGSGSAMQQPLAIAIISGLVVQLPLVLLVMPVLYDLLQRRRDNGPSPKGTDS
jgi:CzcA family heavy metal efflux pump